MTRRKLTPTEAKLQSLGGTITIRNRQTGEVREGDHKVLARSLGDGTTQLLSQVWTWDHPVLSHNPLGQTVKMLLDDSETDWYCAEENAESFRRTLVQIGLCSKKESEWSEWAEVNE